MRAHGGGDTGARAAWSLGTVALAVLLPCSCGGPRRPPVVVTWVVGQAAPSFDPQGPPDPVRWALERLLARGLVEEDSSGLIVPAAAESIGVSADGLVYTFRLRGGLRFADGTPCRSEAFLSALRSGLNRLDHSTYVWLLGAVVGVDRVRAGRPLPSLGVAAPDERTVVIRLARPDSLFLAKLAVPGVAVPWREGEGGQWGDGVGDYRLVEASPTRMTLARGGQALEAPDTVHVRFLAGGARVRSLLRAGAADLVWPPPSDLLDRPLPDGYLAQARSARPPRRLLLVMRADLPPTSKAAARHALAHGLERAELMAALGRIGTELAEWLPGGRRFDFPRHDPERVRGWLERGRLGRSLHVVMAYSADGMGARVARTMQVAWARVGLDVELRPLRQPRAGAEMLRRGGAQLLLVESQALLDHPVAELALLVQPVRGPAVGAFRTGWSIREFDRWMLGLPGARPLDLELAQQRLAEEHVVVPIARLSWVWVERPGAPAALHPRFGPDPRTLRATSEGPAH